MRRPEIVSVCAAGYPGTDRSLRNLEINTGLTHHYVLSSSEPDGVEVEFYASEIREAWPAAIVFGGWCELYEALLAKLPRRRPRIGVYWTSSPGQTGISGEAGKLGAVLGDRRVHYRLFAFREFAGSFHGPGSGFFCLPDTMDIGDVVPVDGSPRGGPAALSLFCSPHEYRRKNILTTLLALAGIEEDYVVFLNGLSRHADYGRLLQRVGVRHRDAGWMSEERYRSTLAGIDVGLQISFAETFNHVAAEHLARGIPMVASPMVPVVCELPDKIRRRMIVASPDSVEGIRRAIRWWIRHPASRKQIGRAAASELQRMNRQRIREAQSVLRQLLEGAT